MSLSRGPANRIEQFRAWLEEFGTALEGGDLGALERLFAVEATYRPTPFAPVLRGRRRIRQHLEGWRAERASVAVTARALGVGSTYAVAHWVTATGVDNSEQDPGSRHPEDVPAVEDGILLAAFDPFGRCTSLRAWTVAGAATPTDEEPPSLLGTAGAPN